MRISLFGNDKNVVENSRKKEQSHFCVEKPRFYYFAFFWRRLRETVSDEHNKENTKRAAGYRSFCIGDILYRALWLETGRISGLRECRHYIC